ncbi:hypothetical protein KJ877_08670 [bacterium]|nr:hypothetical protein [bacterium]MBU1990769.1 hypothetical protein [bacterium]
MHDRGIGKIHYIAYAVLGVGLLVSLFFNLSDEKRETPATQQTPQTEKFENLPNINKKNYTLKNEEENLSTALSTLSDEKQEIDRTINEIQGEDTPITSKETAVSKDFAKCYDMEIGSYIISNSCKKDIIAYVDKHKDAKFFEITGIVDTTDFKLFKNLQSDTSLYERLDTSKGKIELMRMFSETGLAKRRTIEASWIIQAHTKQKARTYNTNYKLTSTHGLRGVIVKAYK